MRLFCSVLLVLCLFATLGCESQPLRHSDSLLVRDVEPSRVLECEVPSDSADQQRFVFVAIDQMNRKLQANPEFSAYAELDKVENCQDALLYMKAFDVYTRLPVGAISAPSNLKKAVINNSRKPQMKVTGSVSGDGYYSFMSGKPSPVVKILPVIWLDNGGTDEFFIWENNVKVFLNEFCEFRERCTATFINKNWLLTAAHCLQDVRRLSVRKDGFNGKVVCESMPTQTTPGQPFKQGMGSNSRKEGVSSWIISWSDTDATTIGETYKSKSEKIGIQAYQHVHPSWTGEYSKLYDVAMLGLDPSSSVDGYLPPDISRQGGTVYLAAEPATDYSGSGHELMVAGYGGTGGAGIDYLLNYVSAPAGLTWKTNGFAEATYVSGGSGVCEGDSGGPIFRKFMPVTGIPQIVQYAITSWASNIDQNDCPVPSATMRWVRLDQNGTLVSWINKVMGNQNFNGFPVSHCNETTIPDGVDNTSTLVKVTKCWGNPCGGSSGLTCTGGKVCVGDGRSFPSTQQCPVCPQKNNKNNCDCIVGQCLAK